MAICGPFDRKPRPSLETSTSVPFHKQQVLTRQHGLAALIENRQHLHHHAVVRLLVVAFSLDRHPDAGVSPMNTGLMKRSRS
jgi:hypothetical protein